MKSITVTLNKLESLGFKEHWPPSPIHGNESVLGSIWHYYNSRTGIYLDYNWYTHKFTAWK